MTQVYGYELILDLHNCNVSTFNRNSLKGFFKALCIIINMERGDLFFWDDFRVPVKDKQTDPKTKGTSAVQFILTSNITIHTLDILKQVYVNIFSCSDFDYKIVENFVVEWFEGQIVSKTCLDRK